MASPPSLTLLMPPLRGSPLKLKPTETYPLINSPTCHCQHIPSPMEPPGLPPSNIRHSPPDSLVYQAAAVWPDVDLQSCFSDHTTSPGDTSRAPFIWPTTHQNTHPATHTLPKLPPPSLPPLSHNISNNSALKDSVIGLFPELDLF